MAIIVLGILRESFFKSSLLRTVFYSSQKLEISESNLGKVVNVAIIGSPNSGKSTLINSIVERRICAASNKVHTTTKMIRAMCYQNDTQIIFLDTPGVVTEKEQKKFNLPQSMIGACYKGMRCADVVGVVHDVSNRWMKDSIHKDVIRILKEVENTPKFLVINKVDKLNSKKQLLTIIRNLTNGFIAGNPIPGKKSKDNSEKQLENGYSNFSDVFLVSALNGDGVSELKEYLISNAKPARYQFPPDKYTDGQPEVLIVEAVRAKFLDYLHQEIPYNLRTQLEHYEDREDEDKIVCCVSVHCPSERILRLVSGAGGGKLQQIKTSIRNDLMDLFKKSVVIDIELKAPPSK